MFGVLAAMVLQEMNARLGVVTREGLGEALRTTFDNVAMKLVAAVLVVSAIGIGGAAFEAGNITGAAIAVESIIPLPEWAWAVVVAAVAFALLWSGVYRAIERALIGLVIVMSVVFLITAIIVRPDVGGLASGLVPSVPSGALLTIVALVGTTVVPYNFFLHASSVQEKWDDSVATDRAPSSSITAPLASSYAICGVLGWGRDLRSTRFRVVWIATLLIGLFFALIGGIVVPVGTGLGAASLIDVVTTISGG